MIYLAGWQNVQLNREEMRAYILFETADDAQQFAELFDRFEQHNYIAIIIVIWAFCQMFIQLI